MSNIERMKCLFLYNPASGRGNLRRHLPKIRRKLEGKYEEVEIVETASAADLRSRVKDSGGRDVIFAGGDGTFHCVLQAAAGRDIRLGYLPTGTVNDVARSLGIPRSIGRALDVILKGEAGAVDCMRVGTHYAMYIAAAGAFTETTYSTPQSQKRALGPLAYAIHGLRYRSLEVFPLKVTCGGRTAETDSVLILVLNGRSVAGFPINKKGSMRDGKLEVAIVRQVKKPTFFRRMGAIFSIGAMFLFGVRLKKRDILFLEGESVTISTKRGLTWDLDGEEGPRGNVDVHVVPAAVQIFHPISPKKLK